MQYNASKIEGGDPGFVAFDLASTPENAQASPIASKNDSKGLSKNRDYAGKIPATWKNVKNPALKGIGGVSVAEFRYRIFDI